MRFFEKQWQDPISVGITTFERRFEKYFVPLIEQIRGIDKEIEIIVTVNGEHRESFSEEYRSEMLTFLASQPLVFPVFFTQFRGLSKLWNTILIHASSDHVLLLNDDVTINKTNFFINLKKTLSQAKGRTFTINRSWSHFVANKSEIDELGYFDERLLGIGEEDGDMAWRYQSQYGKVIPNFDLSGITNHSEETMSEVPANIICHSGGKYSSYNRRFIYQQKYAVDSKGLKGMFDTPMRLADPGLKQYPQESFYWKNKDKL